LRASAVVRHSRLVFPCLARVPDGGAAAHRADAIAAAAAEDRSRPADRGVSKPPRLPHLCAMAAVSPMTTHLSRSLSIGIVAVAALLGGAVLYHTNYYPRTDDAGILANFIGIAPQVEGRVERLHVRDNQFVRQGELLFEIDRRPYQYALEQAISEQSTLEGQIEDERRRIAALGSAVSVAQANIHGSNAEVNRFAAAIDQARADVASAEQGVERAQVEWTYARNNLHRLEPLLSKQFVTVDQVDRARTSEIAQAEAVKQAESQLRVAQAALQSAQAQYERSQAAVQQSKAAHEQARHAVTTLEPLVN